MSRLTTTKYTHSTRGRRQLLKTAGAIMAGALLLPFRALSDLRSILPLREVRRTSFAMGSIVTITAFMEDERLCHRAIDAAFRDLRDIDSLMSVYKLDSQISILNRKGYNTLLAVDRRLFELIALAEKMHSRTGGAFDMTVEPLMKLYGFRTENTDGMAFPSDKEISLTLEAIGMNNIILDHPSGSVTLGHPLTQIDSGGIAVGYALDRSVEILRQHGIESALINHSGDIYALGTPPGETGWEIGIVDPFHPQEILTSVTIRDSALCTSGNYEHVVLLGGERIGHILDPVSGGNPRSVAGVSVIAPTAAEADGFSTAAYVMGLDHPCLISTSEPGIRVFVVSGIGGPEDARWI